MAEETETTSLQNDDEVTTLLNLAFAGELSFSDLLYIVQGTGPTRDRKLTLETLHEFIQGHLTNVNVIGVGGGSALTNSKLRFYSSEGDLVTLNSDGIKFKIDENKSIKFGKDGITFYIGSSEKKFYYDVDGGFKTSGNMSAGILMCSELECADNISADSDGIHVGDDTLITAGTSTFKDIDVSRDATFGRKISSEYFQCVDGTKFVFLKDFLSNTGKATFGRANGSRVVIDGGHVQADGSIGASIVSSNSVLKSNIYIATTSEQLLHPASILSSVTFTGSQAMVKNGTGDKVVIQRDVTGSDKKMTLVVNEGEILLYVFDGTDWVHAW